MSESQYVNEATAFEPQHRIELTARRGPLKPTLTHTFEQTDGQTRYTRGLQIPLEGIFRLVGPVMKATGGCGQENARFAQNLKELLER